MVEDHETQGTQFTQNYEFFIKIESNLTIIKVVHLIMNNQMNNHLMKFCESHSILSDKQHDFRRKRSYESQLILTIQDLAAGLNSKSQIDAILLVSARHLIKSHTRDWQRSYITMESVVTPCHVLKVSWQTESSR